MTNENATESRNPSFDETEEKWFTDSRRASRRPSYRPSQRPDSIPPSIDDSIADGWFRDV